MGYSTNRVKELKISNIIQFPKENNRITSVEDVYSKIAEVQMAHVEEGLDLLIPMIISQFTLLGFNFDFDKIEKDIALIAEVVKALLMKHYELDHPLHQMIDKLITEDENIGYYVPNDLRVLKKVKRRERSKERTFQTN